MPRKGYRIYPNRVVIYVRDGGSGGVSFPIEDFIGDRDEVSSKLKGKLKDMKSKGELKEMESKGISYEMVELQVLFAPLDEILKELNE